MESILPTSGRLFRRPRLGPFGFDPITLGCYGICCRQRWETPVDNSLRFDGSEVVSKLSDFVVSKNKEA